MDETGAKPSQEPKDVPTTMQEMMEAMCCSGQFSPAEMCRRMMRMGRRSNSEPQSAADAGTTSDEGGRSGDDEAPQGCCGRQSRCTPKRP